MSKQRVMTAREAAKKAAQKMLLVLKKRLARNKDKPAGRTGS